MKGYIKFIVPTLLIAVLVFSFAIHINRAKEIIEDYGDFNPKQNTAIYAAYSSDGTVSDYVVDYLKALKEIAPNIIYITDNPIKMSEVNKLKPYITHLEAKKHGEYDWGSYKRGFNWLKEHQFLDKTSQLLIFANDSTLLVEKSFKPIMDKFPSDVDFYGITANQDGTYHLQSYFLVFRPQVYTHPGFNAYLNSVTKQKDGLSVAYHYEVPFTDYLKSLGFLSQTYIPYEQLSFLPLNDKNCYPLTLLTRYHLPLLKMRTFTNRLNVQESRRLVFQWLKNNSPKAYHHLLKHLEHINSPYLKDNR